MRRRNFPSRGGGAQGPVEVSERLDPVGGVTVRSLVAGSRDAGVHVVLLPGLGALGYLLPTLRALAARGARCSLLDLPGFGSARARSAPPTVLGVADAAAAWVAALGTGQRLILAGHSTGAQAALLATLQLQEVGPPAALVLAGPTFAPSQRRLGKLVAVAAAAYRRDSPRELLVLPDYLRAGPDLMTLLRSALADRPEEHAAALRIPLLVTAGEHDAFAPRWWLGTLVQVAGRTSEARCVRLPGSHNNPYTQPELLAELVLTAGTVVDRTQR